MVCSIRLVVSQKGTFLCTTTHVTVERVCCQPVISHKAYCHIYIKFCIYTQTSWYRNILTDFLFTWGKIHNFIHSIYVPMHGMSWVSAAPLICMCMWWMQMCSCLCSSVVLGMVWENAWVDIGCLCCVVRECICVRTCMYKCICLSQGLWICHVQMSKYWCFGWRWRTHVAEAQCLRWMCEARHRTTCMTDCHIRTDKLSHGAVHLTHSNGGWLSWEADM